MEDNVEIQICPFCGKIPSYDKNSQMVHCETIDCAVGDFYIHIEEWNKRFDKKQENK